MYKIVVDHNPSQSENDIVREGIVSFNESILGERGKPFSIYLKNNMGKIVGGILAWLDSESIFIDVIWIEEGLRRQGHGKRLLEATEQEAIKKGCVFLTLDTYSFQAEDFYLKNDYKRIGEIKNYSFGHSKIFLRKNLADKLR